MATKHQKRQRSLDSASRPRPMPQVPLAPIPTVDASDAESASTIYSHYRTELSHLRTELSEHRTDLSEYRTDLSVHRTNLSEGRTDLSRHRTGMALQRTRLSADGALMAVIRTSLSLIGFGFTLHQAFQKLRDAGTIHDDTAPRNFGVSLVVLGILLLFGGIVRHLQFAHELRERRRKLLTDKMIHGESDYPLSITLITAVALLIIGFLAVTSIIFSIAPFG